MEVPVPPLPCPYPHFLFQLLFLLSKPPSPERNFDDPRFLLRCATADKSGHLVPRAGPPSRGNKSRQANYFLAIFRRLKQCRDSLHTARDLLSVCPPLRSEGGSGPLQPARRSKNCVGWRLGMTFSGMVGLELEQAFYLRILVVGRPFSFLVCVRPLVIGSESKKGEGVGVEGFGFIARKQLEQTELVAT